MGLLSLAIWTPIAFGLLLLVLGRDHQAPVARWVALVGSLAGLAVTWPLVAGFSNGTAPAADICEQGARTVFLTT